MLAAFCDIFDQPRYAHAVGCDTDSDDVWVHDWAPARMPGTVSLY